MKNTRHLLLDLDGTLLGSHARLHLAFVLRTLAYFAGKGVGPILALRALHALRMGTENHEPGQVNSRRAAVRMAKVLGIDEVAGRILALEMTHSVFPGLEGCFYPIEGAAAFMEWARNRYQLTLATNAVWPRDIVLLRLKWAGIDPAMFGFIANNDEMHHCKPSLGYYSELVEKLKFEPASALMIGDSKRKDLPAKEIGIPVFLLSNERQAVPAGDKVWRGNFEALKALLEGADR